MTETRADITALDPGERARILAAWGEPAYRAHQLEKWLFAKAADLAEMTDLPATLRDRLANEYFVPRPRIEAAVADPDGTTRYLFRLHDAEGVEAVFIPGEDHDTVCLSSQVGCPLGCRFCATGTLGFRRNLSSYEITACFAFIQNHRRQRRIRNVVFMGQGEPFLNAAAVASAIANLAAFFDVGARRVTVSTAGIPERIKEWADAGPPVKLAVSLTSAVQRTRDRLMPGVSRWPLPALAAACEHYGRRTRRRLTFEYVLVAGVNDDDAHARALVAFTRRVPCKINLIPLNLWPGSPYKGPREEDIARFLKLVMEGPMAVTLRRARGVYVRAACGTLANMGDRAPRDYGI